MSFNSRRVLITGRYGFTGHYLAEELKTYGYSVYGLGCVSCDDPRYFVADLLDKDALKEILCRVKPDYIIHLAGLAFVQHKNIEEIYQVNLLGTRNLLEAIYSSNKMPQSILLASSANVYGNTTLKCLNETAPMAPVNDYAVSKLSMEYMAKIWTDRLPIVVVRPFNYTGVGQSERFLIPKIVAHFRHNKTIIELGNLDIYRDFSDVRFVVKAYRSILEKNIINETFNICSERLHSLRNVIDLCEQLTNHSLKVVINPDFVRKNEVKSLCGDASKLKFFLNEWKVPSLEETLNWMLS